MLNKKGFAFSTMLYGVLSLIMIVLLLLFGVLQSSDQESEYYTSVIEKNMNKCVNEEIALENCYTLGTSFCNTASYYSCLGIVKNGEVNAVRLSEFLKDKVVTSGNGLYKDDAGEMIYKGTEVNNYISFSGDVWRIIKLEADGSIKLAYPRYNKELSWDNDGSTEWSLSSLNNELNKNFYPKLQNTNVIDTRNWKIGRIFNVAQTKEDLKEYESKAYFGIADNASSLVGLPNTSDYISASNDDLCQSDVLNSKNCSSWLKYLPSWTINAASTLDGDVAVYYFENDSTGTKLNKKSPSEKFSVVPVIYLKSSTKIIGGDGSSSNPFILER